MEKAKAVEILNRDYDGAILCRDILRNIPVPDRDILDDVDYLNDLLIALLTAIDALEQDPSVEAEPDNGWISVKDRMPEPKTKVLAHCTNGRMLTVGYFDKDLEFLKSGRVTHWMPLPQKPESEDAE